MIDKKELTSVVEQSLTGTDYYIVDIRVNPANEISVEIDCPEGVDIDTCAKVTRAIENAFDRDVEDYQLEVGSAGLTTPFKVRGQYVKNIGNEIDILTRDGRKLHCVLTAVNDDGSEFTVEIPEKVKEPGKKRPVTVMTPHVMKVADTKTVTYHISFK